MRILVADTDPISRVLLSRFAESSAHELVFAKDAAEAINFLQQPDPPQIALVGTCPSGTDDFELCRRIRSAMGESAPYLLVLSSPQEHNAAAELFDSVDDYLPKPLDAVTLSVRLQIAFRLLELQRCLAQYQNAELDHDPLTGVWGRRAILDHLRAQFARSTRDGVSLAVILGDMDFFYAANAKHGQASCDAILRESARRITGAIRPYDSLGRYSGEEFMIVAPDCTMSGAQGIAERLRSAISDTPFSIAGSRITATISFGVATTAETGALDQDGLLRSADAALLSAKEQGRNRVQAAKRILRSRIPQSRVATSAKSRELVQ